MRRLWQGATPLESGAASADPKRVLDARRRAGDACRERRRWPLPAPNEACCARRFAHRRHQAGAGGPGKGLDTNPRFGSDPASTPPGPLQRSVAVGRTGPPRAAAPGTARGVDCWLCLAPRRRAVATAYHRPRRVPGMRISWVVRFSQELTQGGWFHRLSCFARVLCAKLAAAQGLPQTARDGHRMLLPS